MSTRAKVAVLRTRPDSVLEDYRRLLKLADADKFLARDKTTILKDNISWHYPMPSANTTPWQLEGTILGLHDLGYNDLSCVQNKTVVIDTYKGGPVGIEAVAATLGEETDTLVDVVEPFLLQVGLLARTRRGRLATIKAYEHLKVQYVPRPEDGSLFDTEAK